MVTFGPFNNLQGNKEDCQEIVIEEDYSSKVSEVDEEV